MPEHFHILITPSVTLERAVQFIKGGFSFRAKKELQSPMEIWQVGFSDHRVRDAEDYHIHVDYIHRNPVGRKLVEWLKPLAKESLTARLKPRPFKSRSLASLVMTTLVAQSALLSQTNCW